MITEDYVSFETAKLLKEKGFDELCNMGYDEKEQLIPLANWRNTALDKFEGVSAKVTVPTLQTAMKWLREIHNLYIEVSLNCDRENKNAKIFDASIFNLQNQRYKKLSNIQGYEEACEVSIKYCLENLI